MSESLSQMLFGWPAILLSIGLALPGISLQKPFLCLLGGGLILFPAWYLGHYSILFLSLPLFLFGAAYEISKDRTRRAWIAIIPAFILIGAVGLVVLTQ